MSSFLSSNRRRSAAAARPAALLGAIVVSLLGAPVASAITIPAVPLQSGSAVPPNIMFILDDSGSMHGEIMPSSLVFDATHCANAAGDVVECNRQGIGYVFPRADGVYGGSDYGNLVANVADGSGYGAQVRSSKFNTIYYNPAVTYQPWSNADGTLRANASSTCALHNPELVGTGEAFCRDLTVANGNYNTNRWLDYNEKYCAAGVACLREIADRKFWPASYFNYVSGDATVASSYTKVEISSATALYTGDGRAARTDCAAGVCTYAQEIQNFANWYQYYRSRVLLARAGIGRAFSGLPSSGTDAAPIPRIGFAAINQASSTVDGTATGTLVSGVRPFTGADRTAFFTSLYGRPIPTAGTPLRRALDDVGKYYQRTGDSGPWAKVPGGSDSSTHLACRQSYAILMTDGYWSGSYTDSAGNYIEMGATGSATGNIDGTAGTAIPRPKGATFTYAAVSPFTDSHSDTLADVANYYWRTDLRTSIDNKNATTTANPAYWQHMVTYGVGLGVTGSVDPDAAIAAIGSGAAITWPDPTTSAAAKVDDLLHAAVNSRGGFFSAADPTAFADGLTRVLTSINERTASGSNVAANSVALKDETRIFQASFVAGKWTGELASYGISSSGVATTASWLGSQGITTVADRKVFTWTGTVGSTFPSATQNTYLTANVAQYIKGDTSREQRFTGGTYRNREHLLGDIINSSPAYVKESGSIFIGANDGMLHAFDAEGAGEGTELFAFIPNAHTNATLDKLAKLASPTYGHDYYVDGPVNVSSFQQTPAKNYLVGSLGRGGKGVYFLDVTNPATFAAGNVTGQYIGTDGALASVDSNHMGYSLGKPLIATVLLGNGNSAVRTPVAIVANGINSGTGDPSLFIFNLQTGALLERITAVADSDNGLSSPRGWDVDGDLLIDYVYAGDLKGNVWKFDLSGNAVSDWGLHAEGDPLFVAKDADGNRQPITGGISVAMDPVTFKPWIFFGTGQYLENSDLSSTAVQSMYGFKDLNAALVGLRSADLAERTFLVTGTTIEGKPVRGFEANSALPADKKGWFVDLPAPRSPATTPPAERMVGDPFLLGPVLVAASIVPSSDPCDFGGSGFINAIHAFSGTSVPHPFFDVDGDGSFDDDTLSRGNQQVPVGSVDLGVAMPTSPTVVESVLVAGGSLGTTGTVKVNNPLLKGRISWREILGD